MQGFGSLPLMHQPGEHWMYNTGIHVVGVLLERAGGMSLESVLRQLVLEPLGMVDTAFSVTPDRLDRLTTAYAPDPDSGALEVLDGVEDSYWRRPLAFPMPPGGWCPPSTTFGPSSRWWSAAACSRGGASCRWTQCG